MVRVLGVMIPLASVVLGIGVAFWAIYWEHQKKRLQYEERRLMIEKGMVPPPVLPDARKQKWTPEDSLRRGTVMLFLGIGLGIGYLMLRSSTADAPQNWLRLLSVGAPVVGLLGLGNLVYYFIARNRKPEQATGPEMG